jgi:Na+-transporting methylmalonyl-CoA/oxaloacetate decarboxylase beta subunit
MQTDKQFVNTLEDNIRERGAPSKLISDRAQVEISNKVMDILWTLIIENNPKDFNLDVHVAYTINSDTRTCSITSIGGHEGPTAAYLRTALSGEINRFKL